VSSISSARATRPESATTPSASAAARPHLELTFDPILNPIRDPIAKRERRSERYEASRSLIAHADYFLTGAAAAVAPPSPAEMTFTRKSTAGLSDSWVVMFPFS
jgi:hypothetical protein